MLEHTRVKIVLRQRNEGKKKKKKGKRKKKGAFLILVPRLLSKLILLEYSTVGGRERGSCSSVSTVPVTQANSTVMTQTIFLGKNAKHNYRTGNQTKA